MRNDDAPLYVIATIMVVAILLAVLFFVVLPDDVKKQGRQETVELPKPTLDVTEYEVPSTIKGYYGHVYKMTDRETGESWWVLSSRYGAGEEQLVLKRNTTKQETG